MTKSKPLYFPLKAYEKAKGFFILYNYFDGWIGFLLFRLGVVDSAFLKPKAKSALEWIKANRKGNKISIRFRGKDLGFHFDSNRQLDNTLTNIFEEFVQEQYKKLIVNKKTVVDIGSNICDSALYFFVRGAAKVLAFEPYPYSCNIARRNVDLNHAGSIIKIYNMAVAKSIKTLKVDPKYKNIGTTELEYSDKGNRIKVVTLEKIVDDNSLKNAVLKIDCEGGEYDIICKAQDYALRAFSQIMIEYHFGYHKLVSRLRETGFKVLYTRPRLEIKSETGGKITHVGMIYAHR